MSQMTWEEIIIQIRTQPEFKELVEQAYFEADLPLNIDRFKNSEEYAATKAVMQRYAGKGVLSIADIGSGNGISAVSFALDGHAVTAIEPDTSNTIGSGAIRMLKDHYQLDQLTVLDSFGENLPLNDNSFDVVYIRQAMHHAANLQQFVAEAARILKPGGLLLTVRDHVVYDAKDKAWFLETHALHKFYGGENAFTRKEYQEAIVAAGLSVKEVLAHYDSVINYAPMTQQEFEEKQAAFKAKVGEGLRKKVGPLANIGWIKEKHYERTTAKYGGFFDETKVPGRLYTFIAIKQGA